MKPPSYYSSLQDGGGFLCLRCACRVLGSGMLSRMRWLDLVVPAEIRREVHRSPWVGVTFEASPDNAGGGVPPLRR